MLLQAQPARHSSNHPDRKHGLTLKPPLPRRIAVDYIQPGNDGFFYRDGRPPESLAMLAGASAYTAHRVKITEPQLCHTWLIAEYPHPVSAGLQSGVRADLRISRSINGLPKRGVI